MHQLQSSMESVKVLRGEVEAVEFAWLTLDNAACCEIHLDGETSGLRRLFVRPDFRRRGLATAIFSVAALIAKDENMLALNWTVRKRNAEALAFYRKMGAVVFSDDHLDYSMGIDLTVWNPPKKEAEFNRGVPLRECDPDQTPEIEIGGVGYVRCCESDATLFTRL